MNVLTMIQNRMAEFSKGQKAIANYILESYDKAAFLTANRMGKTVGVSESTVVRFAAELGFDGYPGMQKALQELVLGRLTSVQRIEVANERFSGQNVLNAVLQQDIEMIRSTLEDIDAAAFSGAVDAILAARRIYILGVRSSATVAYFLHNYFDYMFDNVRMVNGASSGEVLEQLARVEQGDVVIAITYPRYSSSAIQAAAYCRDRGATLIALTDSQRSPLAQYADHLLLGRMEMVSLVDSLVAPLSLANALIVAIGSKREKELSRTFSNLERIWDEYEVYKKVEQ